MDQRLTKEQLHQLRREIILGSLYISDYRNSFGIDPNTVCDFFDSFLSYLNSEMERDVPNYNDAQFFDLLPAYDNAEELWEWYSSYEEDPLPLPA